MTQDIISQVKARVPLRSVVEYYGGVQLDRQGKRLCPWHEEKTPSFSVDEERGMYKCFGRCGVSGDAVDFVARIQRIGQLEAAKLIASDFGIDTGDNLPIVIKKSSSVRTTPEINTAKITAYIKNCAAHTAETNYFTRRGLSPETVRKYSLGYDSAQQAIVIPYSDKLLYYMQRCVASKEFHKPKTSEAGTEPLFHADVLYSGSDVIFIVESPLCALSIEQCGCAAVALCGTGAKKLYDQLKTKSSNAKFALCLDNDEAGQQAQNELSIGLSEIGIKFATCNISDECKDPNELLMKEPERLKKNIKSAIDFMRHKLSLSRRISASQLQNKRIAPIRWVVEGLIPQGLSILAAPPKIGKSWMMLQLCLSVATGTQFLGFQTNKTGCYYLALEDGERRLQDRMNKQLSFDNAPDNFLFCNESADVNGNMKTIDKGLCEDIEEAAQQSGVGLVIVDTLQKVRGKQDKDESLYGNDYKQMAKLKTLADRLGICILLVHHLRKMGDDDVYNTISGSQGIMGDADTVMVIKKQKRTDEEATLYITGRDVNADDMQIAFDKISYMWKSCGTVHERTIQKEREDYENNPVVRTIKIIAERDTIWKGSLSQLVAESEGCGSWIDMQPRAVSDIIGKYESQLKRDGIRHGYQLRTRTHSFYKTTDTDSNDSNDSNAFI